MTMFDWILLAFIALMAWQGARAGFIGGALSLVGFVVGALLAARLAPLLLPSGAKSPYAPLIALFGAALGGMALSVLLQGLGDGIRRMLPAPFLGTVDRGFGLVLGLLVGLAVVWLAAIVVVQLPVTASVRETCLAQCRRSTLSPQSTVSQQGCSQHHTLGWGHFRR